MLIEAGLIMTKQMIVSYRTNLKPTPIHRLKRVGRKLLPTILIILTSPGGCSVDGLDYTYDVTPPPKYPLTKDPGDRTQLADHKKSHFLSTSEQNALGWNRSGVIKIHAKLNQKSSVRHACLRALYAPDSDVYPPAYIAIYSHDTPNKYRFIGGRYFPAPKKDKQAGTKRLCLALSPTTSKSLYIYIQPRGKFTISDELSLTGEQPPRNVSTPATGEIIDDPKKHLTDRLSLLPDFDLNYNRLRSLNPNITRAIENKPQKPDTSREILTLDLTNKNLDLIKDLVAKELRTRMPPRCSNKLEIQRIHPWTHVQTSHLFKPSIHNNDPISLLIPNHHSAYFSLALRNCSDKEINADLLLSGPITKDTNITTTIFIARDISTYQGRIVSDALEPSNNLTIPPGQNTQIIIKIKDDSKQTNRTSGNLTIATDNFRTQVAFSIARVSALSTRDAPSFRSNVWSYRNHPIAKKIAPKTIEDLTDHHINVFPISPWDLAPPRSATKDAKIIKWLREIYKRNDRTQFLLYMGLKQKSIRSRYGFNINCSDPNTDKIYSVWITKIMALFEDAMIPSDNVLLYPVDEPTHDNHYDCISAISSANSKTRTNLRLYSTLSTTPNNKALRALDNISVLQLIKDKVSEPTQRYLQSQGIEIWYYSAEPGGKAGDPITSYASIALEAFVDNRLGAGFWTYSDDSSFGSPFNDFDGKGPDYGVIYSDRNTLWSSKRWEAWSDALRIIKLSKISKEKSLLRDEVLYSMLTRAGQDQDNYYLLDRYLNQLFSAKTATEGAILNPNH